MDTPVSTKYFEAFETKLKNAIKDFDLFKKMLIETGAIIAGGSVLSAIKSTISTNDFDIYVNISNVRPLLGFVFGNEKKYRQVDKAKFAPYCPNFINKKGIRSIYRYQAPSSYHNVAKADISKDIDLMAVRDEINVVDVVKSFDLSCCKVWYDGRNLYAPDLTNILRSRATLNGPYVQSFINGNPFTVKRIEKYSSRGFSISLGETKEYTVGVETDVGPTPKLVTMSDDMLNEKFDTDIKRKRMVGKLIFRTLANRLDTSGYDSDDYDSYTKLEEFCDDHNIKKENLDKIVEKFKQRKTGAVLKWYNELVA